jgi:indolepyruvate ferredoxin oxidoreductase, alpha subunit
MPSLRLTGGQALARGALVAGVKVVTSYPGSPSSEAVEDLIALAESNGIYVEWSSNEKVALEIAIGASIAGRRALVGTKSVGLNAMLDPLMALNLTPVHGGLVILLGDDPGGYGSQNDQDSRPLASLLEMPMLEPATPAEAHCLMREAFELSERYHTAVIVRETRSFSQQAGTVDVNEGPYIQPDLGLLREPWRFVPVPQNVVAKHRALHERIDALGGWVNGATYNHIEGEGRLGVIAAGFAYQKLRDVIGPSLRADLRLLKLATLFPLPGELLGRFLAGCDTVLVVEENEPFVETPIKAVAHDAQVAARILGKHTGHLPREGELFRWQIQRALARVIPNFVPARSFTEANEADERPERENHCAGCRYGEIIDALDDVARSMNQRPMLVGDPGCLAQVAARLDAKYAIGSAVGVADGLSKAGATERAIALFGDSSFFHTTLPAIANAVCNGSDILMIVLDNGATVTSGFQPNPGVGRDALGRPALRLSIERIAQACGVDFVRSLGPDDPQPQLRALLHEALTHRGLGLLVIRTKCDHHII